VEVSEGSVLFKVFNEGPAEIGNTFWDVVHEIESVQIGALSGDVFP
jgi:hypothetical protein